MLKSDELAVRPIFRWREDLVRAHLFLCLLAAYIPLAPRGGLGTAPLPRRSAPEARAFELIGVSAASL